MKLRLLRNRFHDNYTTGQLYIDEEFFCFTLEDCVREVEGIPVKDWKVWGETAIPRGIYNVEFQSSRKFGPHTLTLLDVPGFTHIRIHAGNTAEDTEGCIIVGSRLNGGLIVPGTTRNTLAHLKGRLSDAEKMTIQVI